MREANVNKQFQFPPSFASETTAGLLQYLRSLFTLYCSIDTHSLLITQAAMSGYQTASMAVTPHNPSTHPNNRACPRKEFMCFAKFLDMYATSMKVLIIDISKKGMGVMLSTSQVPGTPCAIAFDVVLGNTPERINVWGKVIHCSPQRNDKFRIGIRFTDCDAQSKALIDSI